MCICDDASTEVFVQAVTTGGKSLSPARQKIMDIEGKIAQTPGAMFSDCFPLRHTFGDGLYVREITMPAGMFVVSKIHKKHHPYFILKGDVSVLTEEGVVRLRAPYQGMTPAGTKRVLYIHKETVWTTIHATRETDLEKIEEEIIAKTFDDVLPDIDKMKVLMGAEVTR